MYVFILSQKSLPRSILRGRGRIRSRHFMNSLSHSVHVRLRSGMSEITSFGHGCCLHAFVSNCRSADSKSKPKKSSWVHENTQTDNPSNRPAWQLPMVSSETPLHITGSHRTPRILPYLRTASSAGRIQLQPRVIIIDNTQITATKDPALSSKNS